MFLKRCTICYEPYNKSESKKSDKKGSYKKTKISLIKIFYH